jgi:hypothetical protein
LINRHRGLPVAQRADHPGFDDDLVLDRQVGNIFAGNHAIMKDDDPPLPHNAKPTLSHLRDNGISETVSTNP